MMALGGPWRPSSNPPRYLVDDSWIEDQGARHLRQSIHDELFAVIERADRLVHLALFLFNDWQGPQPERHRALADELMTVSIDARTRRPELVVTFVTDPINTVHGGLPSGRLDRLREAGGDIFTISIARRACG